VLTGTGGGTADTFSNPGHLVTSITQPSGGQVTYAADGTMTFAPDAGFTGTTAFTYTVSSGGGSESATVTVTVHAATGLSGQPGIPPELPPATVTAGERPEDITRYERNVQREVGAAPLATPFVPILATINAIQTESRLLGVQGDAVDGRLITGASQPDLVFAAGVGPSLSVQDVIRASQAEASLLAMKVENAYAQGFGNPLFDPIGLDLLRGAQHPLAQVAATGSDGERSTPAAAGHATQPGPDGQSASRDRAIAAAEPQVETAPQRRSAPSFSEQLRLGSQALRTTGERNHGRPTADVKVGASRRV